MTINFCTWQKNQIKYAKIYLGFREEVYMYS